MAVSVRTLAISMPEGIVLRERSRCRDESGEVGGEEPPLLRDFPFAEDAACPEALPGPLPS